MKKGELGKDMYSKMKRREEDELSGTGRV